MSVTYGSRVNGDGTPVVADGKMPVKVGESVPGHVLKDVVPAKDQNGDPVSGQWEIQFVQPSGAIFSPRFFSSTEEWAIEETNRHLLHIAKRVMSENDYFAAIGTPNSFDNFMRAFAAAVVPAAAALDKTFTLKITVNKSGYPSIPKYGSFMELDGTDPTTLSTNPKYDKYVKFSADTADTAEEATAEEDKNVF